MNSQKIEIPKYNSYVKDLVQLAIHGLNDFYNETNLEFAERKILNGNDITIKGVNVRYTLINLIGLHKAISNDFNISLKTRIDLKSILRNQITNLSFYESVGDIGLLLWATSLISPDDLNIIIPKINFSNILNKFNDARSENTKELSWLLIGILMASTFNKIFKSSISNLPNKLYKVIRNNYGGNGVFKHSANESLNGKLRSNSGNFADQVYSIYAFVLFSKLMKNEEALLIAEATAQKICELQGNSGEWMWHYSVKTGDVISKYPIYSIHQDALAPIALYSIQAATGKSYEKYIFKGIDWLFKNSLNTDLICNKHNAVWDGIGPDKTYRKVKSILSHLGIIKNIEYKNLKVLNECSSFHLGWLLYAFAGRVNHTNNIQKIDEDKLRIFNLNFSKN
jgi:hypothetical protein